MHVYLCAKYSCIQLHVESFIFLTVDYWQYQSAVSFSIQKYAFLLSSNDIQKAGLTKLFDHTYKTLPPFSDKVKKKQRKSLFVYFFYSLLIACKDSLLYSSFNRRNATEKSAISGNRLQKWICILHAAAKGKE